MSGQTWPNFRVLVSRRASRYPQCHPAHPALQSEYRNPFESLPVSQCHHRRDLVTTTPHAYAGQTKQASTSHGLTVYTRDTTHGVHPRMNRTDVETLCPSFGSFARIAQADAAQLARLPEFGLKAVIRLKAAFGPPVRTERRAMLSWLCLYPPLPSQHLHPLSPFGPT
ncbi:hypothetical protein EDB89DRAFT_234006 [Lactarius sanguifluus]|nr:hypothetical protein EDB89DRAFT_234006 [Lactarius sanguifluus]